MCRKQPARRFAAFCRWPRARTGATSTALVAGEGIMSTCGKLFHANQIYAYHDNTKKQVVVLADVTLNPVADDVHLCPNLIAPPSSREFLVEGTTKPGIHPALAV